MADISRRDWMALAGTGAAAGLAGAAAPVPADSLHAIAKGLGFGSCIGNSSESNSFADAGVRGVHLKECGIVVPENELKWMHLRPDPKEFRR